MRKRMRMGASARRRFSIAAGAVVLAFGAIVLARAHRADAEVRRPDGDPPGGATHAGPTRVNVVTDELEGFIALTQGAVLAHGTRELFAELRLEARAVPGDTRRRPVAIAVVLDTSGSMTGDKIEQARASVHALADRMRPEDRLAVITYDHFARVVQPLAPVGHVRETLHQRIDLIHASGGTNIPAGLQLGASTLSSAPATMVRRLVLISDGLDGSGRILGDVGREVAARANAGVTTSALGVGTDYDERWLTTVADSGRGNYEFLAHGGELSGFLARELDQARATVAEGVTVHLALPQGWRITAAHGGTFDGSRVPLGSLFAGERRHVTLRLEVDAGDPGDESGVGITLRYRSPAEETDRNLDLGRLSLSVVGDEAQVVASRDITLHAEAVAQHVDVTQALAIEAWRDGRVEEARRLTQGNIDALQLWRGQAPQAAAMLDSRIQAAEADLDNIQNTRAGSQAGRAYGLRANALRRARAVTF